jgi:hypothetical protein
MFKIRLTGGTVEGIALRNFNRCHFPTASTVKWVTVGRVGCALDSVWCVSGI